MSHIPHLPFWAGPAAIMLLVALFAAGPVRRHWRRLVTSLVIGLAVAAAVTGWADRNRHAALAAHGAASAGTLITVFAVVTAGVTVAGLLASAVLGRRQVTPAPLPVLDPHEAAASRRAARRAARLGGAR
jgi:hypothetical protein